MDSADINCLLSHIPNFLGVFPSDCLPTVIDKSKTFGLVVNTDSSEQCGTHWLAIVVQNEICHYFDSFGGQPKVNNILSFCEQFPICYYNRKKHQNINEITCGAYCIFVINEMLANKKSFRYVVSTFHRIKRDDVYVRKYLSRKFSFHILSTVTVSGCVMPSLCNICQSQVDDLPKHFAETHFKIYCLDCNRIFSSVFSRKRHQKVHLSQEEVPQETDKKSSENIELICNLGIYKSQADGTISVKVHSS